MDKKLPASLNQTDDYDSKVDDVQELIERLSLGERECSICLETIDDINLSTIRECQHEYHFPCIRKWIVNSTSNICPLCRCDFSRIWVAREQRYIDNVTIIRESMALQESGDIEDCYDLQRRLLILRSQHQALLARHNELERQRAGLEHQRQVLIEQLNILRREQQQSLS